MALGISKAMGGPGLDWKSVCQYCGTQRLRMVFFAKLWSLESVVTVFLVHLKALPSRLGLFFSLSREGSAGLWRLRCLAGVTAAICYSLLYGQSFNLTPTAGFGWLNAGVCEMLYTLLSNTLLRFLLFLWIELRFTVVHAINSH